MKIIIPMAGHSRRFQNAGYTIPKPFIDIGQSPMIHWVTKMFSNEDHFVFIGQKSHFTHQPYVDILRSAAAKVDIVPIDSHDMGPVFSSLAAGKLIDDDEECIICYCDLYQHWNYNHFLMKARNYEGGIAVFRGFHPASFGDTYYAYVKTNEQDEMVELREKQSFTDKRHEEYASSGVYYFRHWSTYKKYAQMILDQRCAVGSEYYVSLVYNLMVKAGLTVTTYEIEKFICWGTPEDIAHFLFWMNFFEKDKKKIDSAICLV